MPLTIKRTNTVIAAANSVQFNGSNQYLSVANNAAFSFGTGNYTVEGWMYFNVLDNYRPLFSNGAAIAGAVGLYTNPSKKLQYDEYYGGSFIGTTVLSINTWYHVAVTRSGSTIRLFLNGNIENSNTTTFNNNTDGLIIGGAWIQSSPHNTLNGYISNFRIVKGTALYTASFTPSTSPLTAIANTSILTCNAATIIDGSTNNFTITNNNSATVSSTTPFAAASPNNNFQFARRTSKAVGKSVLFNGTNQYLSIPRILDNSTDVTIEAWVYTTSTPLSNGGYIVSQYVGGAADRTLFAVDSTLKAGIQIGSAYVSSAAAITLNTWYHLAWVRSGSGANNFSIYINGVRDGQMTYTGTFQNTPTTIGGTNNLASTYFPGYISNLRILKGTALYTGASFSVPTTPLTAIANTALLACNADTIFDSSNNNFTITNNNSATVSSISPFVVSSGGMSLKKVYADPLFGTQRAIFGYGWNGTTYYSMTNLVSNTGVVATDISGVGTARYLLAAAGYGSDKAIFGYGRTTGNVSMTNLVSNTGVVATDISGVGTARYLLAAAGYGSDKAIFGYGYTSAFVSITNLVSNTGVVSTDTTGVGTARHSLAATGYGTDKAIFGYGYALGNVEVSMTNLVSNTGVVATDTTGVGTARNELAAAVYGGDKAIFGYGSTSGLLSITNLVSNTGVVSTNTTGVGTAREQLAAASYAGDKSIFGYGYTSVNVSMTNLVSNTGVVATDTTGVGTARQGLAAAGYSLT